MRDADDVGQRNPGNPDMPRVNFKKEGLFDPTQPLFPDMIAGNYEEWTVYNRSFSDPSVPHSSKSCAGHKDKRYPPAATRMARHVPPPRTSRFGSPLVLSRVHWVRPELVAEVMFLTWTEEGLLRQVIYQGLRQDKWATCQATSTQVKAWRASCGRDGVSGTRSARPKGLDSRQRAIDEPTHNIDTIGKLVCASATRPVDPIHGRLPSVGGWNSTVVGG